MPAGRHPTKCGAPSKLGHPTKPGLTAGLFNGRTQSPAQRAYAIKRRKEIWEARNPQLEVGQLVPPQVYGHGGARPQKKNLPPTPPNQLAELLERARLDVKRYRLLHPEWPHAPQHQAMIERLDDLEVPQLAQQRAGETPAPVSKPDDLHPAAYHHPALAYPVA